MRANYCLSAALLFCCAASTVHAQPPASLPNPADFPLEIDFSRDPVLALARSETNGIAFRDLIAAAVRRHPGTAESSATQEEAVTLVQQAEEAQRPSVDMTITSYSVLSREFSNDPFNIIERSRPTQRTDAIFSINQLIFDFGASEARISAAGARLRGASADVEAEADRIALSAVAAWYDVFGYRALVELTRAFLVGQRGLRLSIQERIRRGASAEGDLARVDSYIAQGEVRLAQYVRRVATAEARFIELTGSQAPAGLLRAPAIDAEVATRDDAAMAAQDVATVRSAEAFATGARHEATAAEADRMPQITAGIDAGRYGVFENDRDYDVRARIGIRQRLFGGVEPRMRQYQARARAAEARADRVRVEAERDAAVAFADVQALEQQIGALERAYRASRQSRDVIVGRFQAARGDLFDVISSEDNYFTAATAYIQGLTELDAARYILLSRTGRLLDRLGIDPDRLGRDRLGDAR